MGIDPEAIVLAKRFEPILLFHPDETFFPIDPKFYLERCALWRSEPPSDKSRIGANRRALPSRAGRSLTKARSRRSRTKGTATGRENLARRYRRWGHRPFWSSRSRRTERPPGEDRFLQLTGWEPFVRRARRSHRDQQ